jgi:hypothetical protein
MIRKYFLDSESKPGGTDISYSLIFDNQGNMLVEEHQDFDQPYKKDRFAQLNSANFDNFKVNGISLKELVVKKLNEILPPSK